MNRVDYRIWVDWLSHIDHQSSDVSLNIIHNEHWIYIMLLGDMEGGGGGGCYMFSNFTESISNFIALAFIHKNCGISPLPPSQFISTSAANF